MGRSMVHLNRREDESVIKTREDEAQKGRLFNGTGLFAITLILTLSLFYLSSCTTTSGAKTGVDDNIQDLIVEQERLEKDWGIEIQGIRLSAVGYMLDFRYKVIDPDKAAMLVNRKSKTFLIDEESGVTVQVPVPAKIGPLRQTVKNSKPKAGRTYMVIFANPGMFIKSGNKVTVAIGDFMAKNLIVQ